MSELRLQFRPGINVEATETANRGGWSKSNLIRWRSSFPEKIGGWRRICDTKLTGVCRTLHWWLDLTGLAWLSCGTNRQLALIQHGVLYDITPADLGAGLASSTPGMPNTLRIWSLDNFGENLLAVPSGGRLYNWLPKISPGVGKAVIVGNAPVYNQGGLVSMPQRIVILFGSSIDGGTKIDPLLLRWSDVSDYSVWTATTANQAGSFRLPRGSRIIGAIQFPLTTLVWTNLDLWSMTYIGFPLVFSTTQVGALCGLIAQNAACSVGSIAYWMSDHGFFRFALGGAPEQMECSVWDVVFKDLDFDNQDKIIAASNYNFSEVAWYYPSLSGGTGEIDSYVKVNILEGGWDYGKLARTAWTDQNAAADRLSDGQFGADLNGFIQQHEIGYDADGEIMQGVMLQSGYIDMEDGSAIQVANRFMPDFLMSGNNPEITISLLFRNFPNETPTVAGPFRILSTTEFVSVGTYLDPPANTLPVLGIRAREVALRIECNDRGAFFRVGTPRLRIQKDGSL